MTLVLHPESIEEVRNDVFHFSFYKSPADRFSTGENIEATNVAQAYFQFKEKHPNTEPFCIHNKSLISK